MSCLDLCNSSKERRRIRRLPTLASSVLPKGLRFPRHQLTCPLVIWSVQSVSPGQGTCQGTCPTCAVPPQWFQGFVPTDCLHLKQDLLVPVLSVGMSTAWLSKTRLKLGLSFFSSNIRIRILMLILSISNLTIQLLFIIEITHLAPITNCTSNLSPEPKSTNAQMTE